jgi:hypothetical protein
MCMLCDVCSLNLLFPYSFLPIELFDNLYREDYYFESKNIGKMVYSYTSTQQRERKKRSLFWWYGISAMIGTIKNGYQVPYF